MSVRAARVGLWPLLGIALIAVVTAVLTRVAPAAGPKKAPADIGLAGQRIDGYRGIWFTLGQKSEYGDKYSGGLGTYTPNHVPIAVYAPAVDKTFFVYGGTTAADQRHLLCMASSFDHKTGQFPKPIVVHDKLTVNDPHDNAALNIDEQGYLWVFISGRGRLRPGFKYRSTKPYSTEAFERIEEKEMTYPQIHMVPGKGFFHLFTKYTNGRELYWQTSPDGKTWTEDQKLAGMGGHYQVSNQSGDRVATTFMYHPGGNVDKRTNLYYAQTVDMGKTWTTVDGKTLVTPLTDKQASPLLIDYEAQHLNVYIHDLRFDSDGHPVILYITSKGAAPGPQNGPYTWRITRWTGTEWVTHDVTTSDHNYDTGSLYVNDDGGWRIVGPTDVGPQAWGSGGEMVAWNSHDYGATWQRGVQITHDSKLNQTFARRPKNAKDPFFTFWADGDPRALSPSHLYFTNEAADHVWQFPYDMTTDMSTATEVKR